MPEITRAFTNFLAGELTYHEAIEGGEYTAQEMVNLRAGSNGELRQRNVIVPRGIEQSANITGLAASQDRLFYIQAEGQLFWRNKERLNQRDIFIQIKGRRRNPADGVKVGTGLSGRLSLIHQFEDFHIITSEGTDQGYWIDLREETLVAYPLGFDPPTFTPTAKAIKVEGQGAFPTGFPRVVYRFTYIRDIRTADDLALGKELPDEPFAEIESNPSPPLLMSGATAPGQNIVLIEGITFPNDDGLERGIAVYRSRGISERELNRGATTINDEDLDFRRVGFYTGIPQAPGANPPGRTELANFTDSMNDAARATQKALRFDNDRLPSTVKSFCFFNDIVWAPNQTELRYSDVRSGELVTWAYPKVNSVRQPVETTFAQPYRNQLLWGGRDGLWRLTGTTEYNFDINRLSNLGPLHGYAAIATEDVMGYISMSGMHLSDGISTTDISDPLDGYFENREPIDGTVTFFPNGQSLWSLTFAELDGTLSYKTFLRGKQWTQWDGLRIAQSANFTETEITGDTTTKVLIVENIRFTREIQWENINGTQDGMNFQERLPIAWRWRSQRLDWEAEGIAATIKKFTKLIIQGKADYQREGKTQPIHVTFRIYDETNSIQQVIEETTLDRPNLYKTQVPIQRRGMAIDFEIAGKGNVDIRSLVLQGTV